MSHSGEGSGEEQLDSATEAAQDPEIIVRTFIGGLARRSRPERSDFWLGEEAPLLPADLVCCPIGLAASSLLAAQGWDLQLPVHLAE
jgi:hypothetical protein